NPSEDFLQIADKKKDEFAQDDDYAILIGGRALTVSAQDGVLRNDYAADRSKLKVTGIAEKPQQEADPDNFKVNDDGSFTYKPKDGWKEKDTFKYEVTDGTSTMTVTVVIYSGQYIPLARADVKTEANGGVLLAGGGDVNKIEDGIKRMIESANGGDLVVLQA